MPLFLLASLPRATRRMARVVLWTWKEGQALRRKAIPQAASMDHVECAHQQEHQHPPQAEEKGHVQVRKMGNHVVQPPLEQCSICLCRRDNLLSWEDTN